MPEKGVSAVRLVGLGWLEKIANSHDAFHQNINQHYSLHHCRYNHDCSRTTVWRSLMCPGKSAFDSGPG
jgi:hypothetical protein